MTPPGADLYRSRHRLRRLAGAVFGIACLLATLTGVVVLTVLLGAVIVAALRPPPEHPWYDLLGNARELFGYLRFLAGKFGSSFPAKAGYRAGIAGTLWLLALTALLAIPIGVGAAVYLEEFAPPGRLRRAIQVNIANLAGVPSIVYGILGLAAFARAFGFAPMALGKSLWSGALTLGLLILPVIIITTQEALRAVPSSLRQGAMALGATRWQVVRDHVLPSALPGILTGTILALSRAIGETAPLLMVGAAASIRWVPNGPGDLYTALPVEIYNYATRPDRAFQSVAAGGILILMILLLSMNAVAILIRNRSQGHR
ncbi:MAG: phosphate ABC transporter permease PstA [Isosphaeraceae bacterium]|nr:phosphate ABC transporter permease PstA [Isosphaeraceae bacterium]